jgi:hypothetical protein
MADKLTQTTMFSQGEDLPLFSGTPQRVEANDFTPTAEPQQAGMFECGACRDTGMVGDKLCTCEAGQARDDDPMGLSKIERRIFNALDDGQTAATFDGDGQLVSVAYHRGVVPWDEGEYVMWTGWMFGPEKTWPGDALDLLFPAMEAVAPLDMWNPLPEDLAYQYPTICEYLAGDVPGEINRIARRRVHRDPTLSPNRAKELAAAELARHYTTEYAALEDAARLADIAGEDTILYAFYEDHEAARERQTFNALLVELTGTHTLIPDMNT